MRNTHTCLIDRLRGIAHQYFVSELFDEIYQGVHTRLIVLENSII